MTAPFSVDLERLQAVTVRMDKFDTAFEAKLAGENVDQPAAHDVKRRQGGREADLKP